MLGDGRAGKVSPLWAAKARLGLPEGTAHGGTGGAQGRTGGLKTWVGSLTLFISCVTWASFSHRLRASASTHSRSQSPRHPLLSGKVSAARGHIQAPLPRVRRPRADPFPPGLTSGTNCSNSTHPPPPRAHGHSANGREWQVLKTSSLLLRSLTSWCGWLFSRPAGLPCARGPTHHGANVRSPHELPGWQAQGRGGAYHFIIPSRCSRPASSPRPHLCPHTVAHTGGLCWAGLPGGGGLHQMTL